MRTDDDIIRLCQQGRSEGFSSLLEMYQGRVYRRAYSFLHHREDALDATQEVFMRVLKSIDRFRSGHPIWPWLRQVTTNLCLNRIREKQARPDTVSFDEAWDRVEEISAEDNPKRYVMDA